MSRSAARGALAMALALALLEGCAALMPVQTSTSPAATPSGSSAGSSAAAGSAAAESHAALDSLPSADAQRVLDSIPEPIPAAERVAAPAVAPADSARAGGADSTRGAVPVPEPTAPLGEKPGSAELAAAAGGAAMVADSLAPHGASAASGGAGAGTAAAPATATPAGPCYRLQVAAPTDRQQAENMKRAAESQLELPFTITKVKTLYKVRTRDCLNETAVKSLRERARASGFSGAFTVAEDAK